MPKVKLGYLHMTGEAVRMITAAYNTLQYSTAKEKNGSVLLSESQQITP